MSNVLLHTTHIHTPYNQKETRKKLNKNDNPLSSKGLNNQGPQNKTKQNTLYDYHICLSQKPNFQNGFTLILEYKISQISLKDHSI